MNFDFNNRASFIVKLLSYSAFFIMIFIFIAMTYIMFFKTNLDKQQNETIQLSESVKLFIDPKTKCEYLIWEGYKSGNITPRLNSNNQIICEK